MYTKARGWVVIFLCILVVCISGCSPLLKEKVSTLVLREQPPVHIITPQEDEILVIGEAVAVKADIKVPFHVKGVIIELWNPTTKYKHEWKIENAELVTEMSLDEIVEIPLTTPPGNNYRLDVSAFSALNGAATGLGYTIHVTVVDAQ